MSTPLKIFTWLLVGLAVSLVGWLALLNIPWYGQAVIEMELGKDTPRISSLGPPPRVKRIDDYQKIFESPVYFDVRTLPWYKKAQVYVTYEEAGLALAGLGGQTAPRFSYNVIAPTVIRDLESNQKKAVFDVDLSWVYQNKNFRRFLLEVGPGEIMSEADERPALILHELKVFLYQ